MRTRLAVYLLACALASGLALDAGGASVGPAAGLPLAVPGEWHQKNTGGSDGAGLCVFASLRHTGLMQQSAAFAGLFEYMRRFPGGGYPSKVDAVLARYCAERGLSKPAYLHSEDGDLALLEAACASGRLPGVTYGRSPTGRYGGRKIAHMVTLVHAEGDRWVILDNNYPGSSNYEHMTRSEFRRAHETNGPWAVVLLDGPVSPVPYN